MHLHRPQDPIGTPAGSQESAICTPTAPLAPNAGPPLPAGRELDTAVAVLLGWREVHQGEQWNYVQGHSVWLEFDQSLRWNGLRPSHPAADQWNKKDWERIPNYSTSISFARQVVEHVCALGPDLATRYSAAVVSAVVARLAPTGGVGGWTAGALWLRAKPEDLCRAALATLEVQP